ncbi:unnamed protein product [marine sediment metagenome]|uniref:Uncharacterized protein n=1 Tax=marine sediment metagenome TaxID=412755 RepID=X1K438_9ZZZZ
MVGYPLGWKELAHAAGVSTSTIYKHKEQLGALRIGEGPRPRLRFPSNSNLAGVIHPQE